MLAQTAEADPFPAAFPSPSDAVRVAIATPMLNCIQFRKYYVDMASELIQFRLSGAELEALKAIAQEGESLNLAAQRLVKEIIAASTELSTAPSIPSLEERFGQIVEAKLSDQNDILIRLQERIQKVEKQLGEFAA